MLTNKIIVLVDCSGVAWSCAYKLYGLAYEGVDTGVLYGFFKKIISDFDYIHKKGYNIDYVVFCWDSRKSKRKELYSGYKEGRKKVDTPEEIAFKESTYMQLSILKKFLLKYPNGFEFDGYEADDIIATICKKYGKTNKIFIISSDNDLFQLLDMEGNIVQLIKPKEEMTGSKLKEQYNITPNKWVMVKAIAGCSSDDVPGVKNVGMKSAIKYLNRELPSTSVYYKRIKDSLDDVYKKWKPLVKLPFDDSLYDKINLTKASIDIGDWMKFCKKYGLKSLMSPHFIRKVNVYLGS